MSEIYTKIYAIVSSVPRGRVLTYGLISYMIGGRMSAQGVGWALKALGRAKSEPHNKRKPQIPSPSLETIPWQRVVNSQGGTSTHKIPEIPPGLQQALLEAEGIFFDTDGKMDLRKYLWTEGLDPAMTHKIISRLSKSNEKKSRLKIQTCLLLFGRGRVL